MPNVGISPERAREIIEANSAFADTSEARAEFARSVNLTIFTVLNNLEDVGNLPAVLTSAHRYRNVMARFGQFLTSTYLSDNQSMVQLRYENARAAEMDLSRADTNPEAQFANPIFDNPADPIRPLLTTLVRDTQLRQEWMTEVDRATRASSQETLAQIDADKDAGRITKKDVVIIGDGPIASAIAADLSPYLDVTIITRNDQLCAQWRNRMLHINSSAIETNLTGPRLPVITETSTTPTTPTGRIGNLRPSDLVDATALKVKCDNGLTKQYLSGPRLGVAVASELALNADAFILGNEVNLEQTIFRSTGEVRLALKDAKGVRRQLDADVVIYAGGPGEETCKFTDAESLATYQKYVGGINSMIGFAKSQLTTLDALIALERTESPSATRAEALATLETLKAEVNIELPRVLTLTALEKIYAFWEADLKRDTAKFPLAPALKRDAKIAVIGNGDTGKVGALLFDGKGPAEAYPQDAVLEGPRIALYNEVATNPADYRAKTRLRYAAVLTNANSDRVTTYPGKAIKCTEAQDDEGRVIGVDVVDIAPDGSERTIRYDYVLQATGYTRFPIEDRFPKPLDIVADTSGQYACGLGYRNFFVAGTATGFGADEFGPQTAAIFEALGIGENTLALWANLPPAERLALKLLTTSSINFSKMRDLLAYAQQQQEALGIKYTPSTSL